MKRNFDEHLNAFKHYVEKVTLVDPVGGTELTRDELLQLISAHATMALAIATADSQKTLDPSVPGFVPPGRRGR